MRRSRCSTARTSTRSSSISTCRARPGWTCRPGSPRTAPTRPVVVITAFGTLETAVAAIRAGAYDFVTKPFELGAVALTLDRAVGYCRLRSEVRRLRLAAAADQMDFDQIGLPGTALVGRSPAMRRTFDTILTRGGDGRDGAGHRRERHGQGAGRARAPRSRAPRAAARSSPSTARAMPETLLESELFGHVRGAFTGARAGRTGLFVQATGGTLFLDEIGELPLALQAKLLRVLQERTRAAGGRRRRARRSTCASSPPPTATSKPRSRSSRFREDLYYRLNVIRIDLPPLRERGDDVLLLAQHFVEQLRGAQPSKNVVGLSPRPRPSSCSPTLAGQRARAAELHRARGRADPLRGDHRRRPARADPELPAHPDGAGPRRSGDACRRWKRSSGATSCACWRP